MPHTQTHSLPNVRAAFKNGIGSGAALLVALACSVATGEKRMDVRTAFRDVVGDDSEPAPPTQPLPAPSQANQTGETLPAPAATASSHYEPQHIGHCCPPPAYTRWPVIGPLHRRWITHTKPHLQASHWGYPEYFVERPYGSYVIQAEQMQIVNGLRDQQVLYNYDFTTDEESPRLTPRGEYQLDKIVQRMQIAPCPIIIQISDVNNPNPELDEERRQSVLEELRKRGVPAADDMVVVGRPPVPGLQGIEAGLIYNNLLGQTEARGGGFDYDPAGDTLGGNTTVNFFNGGVNSVPQSR
jgi:hypothetical protein